MNEAARPTERSHWVADGEEPVESGAYEHVGTPVHPQYLHVFDEPVWKLIFCKQCFLNI